MPVYRITPATRPADPRCRPAPAPSPSSCVDCRGRAGHGWRGSAGIGRRGFRLSSASGRLSSPHLPVTRPAIHNSRVPVANVSRPPGGGLLAVLWPQGWVYWPNNGHCSACHTKLLSVTRRTNMNDNDEDSPNEDDSDDGRVVVCGVASAEAIAASHASDPGGHCGRPQSPRLTAATGSSPPSESG